MTGQWTDFRGQAMRNCAAFLAVALLGSCTEAEVTRLATSAGEMTVEVMARGLDEPWAIAFLPDGSFLVTERGGTLNWYAEPLAEPTRVSGLPEVWVEGQGGLLDVMVPRDFSETRELWFTYSAPLEGGGASAIGKAILAPDSATIAEFEQVFLSATVSSVAKHFGSRLVEAPDGTIFACFGERDDGTNAQDLSVADGKVLHLNRDGSPATRLPFALPGVFTAGLRNPQGATLDPAGQLLTIEHGPKGGDELNRHAAGDNFGWPLVTYGRDYDGKKVGIGRSAPFVTPPLHYWDPSIAPSGLLVYSGKLIPEWTGDIFFGSLNSDFLGRLDPDLAAATGFAEERISGPMTGRVRDVVEAPDGSIWFLSVHDGALYRLAPAN